MRERNVSHDHLDLTGASSISELEMFDRYPPFRVPHETDMLVREGFVALVDGEHVLTPKGTAERQRERDPKAWRRRPCTSPFVPRSSSTTRGPRGGWS